MSDLPNVERWFLSNLGNILLLLLIIATVVAPTLIYVFERRRIPKLAFNGYFKVEETALLGPAERTTIIYYVMVTNINNKSEGRIEACAGNITCNNRIYRTIWEANRARHYSFGKEALLKLFHIKNNQIKFTNMIGENGLDVTPDFMYAEYVHNNITIELESARGHCPKPLTESIENIVRNSDKL
jgi:hypothetical protein